MGLSNWNQALWTLYRKMRLQTPSRRRTLQRIVAAEVLEQRLCLSGNPVVTSLTLDNDTGDPNDNITTDPTFKGTTQPAQTGGYVDLEIDYNNDGVTDQYHFTDANGNFVFDPTNDIEYGEITIQVRPAEYDSQTMSYNYGAWVALAIDFQAPPPPTLDMLGLKNDTGEAGDLMTQDPTLEGIAEPGISGGNVDVEIDFDGDSQMDDLTYPDLNGNFEYDPSSHITYGEVTIYVRSAEYDPETSEYRYSAWEEINFVFEEPDAPELTSLGLYNDTGTLGDNETEDPTLTGMTQAGTVNGYVDIEIDFDGDGTADDFTFTNQDGSFTYDPSSSISYGEVTLYVRASEWDNLSSEYRYSDWFSISFTYLGVVVGDPQLEPEPGMGP